MTTFNIGDRIEFTEDYGMSAKTGDQGVITDIDREDDLADIKMDKGGNASAFTFRFKKIAYSTFKVGDRVEFTEDYLWVFKGGRGKVTAVNESFPASENGLVTVKLDSGETVTAYGIRLRLEVKAEPKFKVGDRVNVIPNSGYIYHSHAGKPLVVLAIEGNTYGVGAVGNDASKSHSSKGWFAYPEDRLELHAPTFEVGDWAEVWGYDPNSSWEGQKGEVTSVDSVYVIVDTENNGEGGFRPTSLRKVERPASYLKVGDWAEIKGFLSGKTSLEGKKGEVIDTYGGTTTAKLRLPDTSMGWGTFDVTCLRKVERPKSLTELEQSTFKKGDKVTIVNKHTGLA